MGRTKDSRSPYQHALEEIDRVLDRRADPIGWIESNLWLRTKQRTVAPFLLNPAQRDYYRRRTTRDVVLKGRQIGCSTMCCALLFADTVLQPNVHSAIVAHDFASSKRLFQIIHRFWELLPEQERAEIGKPRIYSQEELYWPSLGSRLFVGTAGSRSFGRSQTFDSVLCSEFARWPEPEAALTSLTEAVPATGRIIVESTPEGIGNPFHELWIRAKAGENGYWPHFYAWWWDLGYRLAGPPLEDITDEEAELVRAHDLDEDQLRWRRAKMRELRDRFAQEYPESDLSCFLSSGRCCFDSHALAGAGLRIAGEPQPEQIPSLPDRSGQPLAISPARLFIWRRPEAGHSYVVGADTGEGLDHSDPSAACVLDEESGEQAAELQGRVSPQRFARLLDALGRYYHDAHLAVERNGHGHSTLSTLLHTTQYPALYHHSDYDQSGRQERRPGWPTNQKTKPIMVDDLAEAIAGGQLLIHSSELLDECRSFVTTDSGATEAQAGRHDDRVIAAAIAWQVRKRPRPVFRIARA
jgi:hypothetical protein